MDRSRLENRVSTLISQLSMLRSSISELRGKEAAVIAMMKQERSYLEGLEGELQRLHDELQDALAAEAYDDTCDDDQCSNDSGL